MSEKCREECKAACEQKNSMPEFGSWDDPTLETVLQSIVRAGVSVDVVNETLPWNNFSWRSHTSKIEVGQAAPNSSVAKMDGTTTSMYRLIEEFKDNRPIVLVFGSITCPILRGMHLSPLLDAAQEFADKINFLFVYTKEAHLQGEWQVDENIPNFVFNSQAATLEEKATRATRLMELNPYLTPTNVVLDTLDGSSDHAYEASVYRAYVIQNHTILFQSGLGPFQCDPSSLRSFLESL